MHDSNHLPVLTAILVSIVITVSNEVSESMTTAVDSGAFQRASEQMATQAYAPLELLAVVLGVVILWSALNILYRLVRPAFKNSSDGDSSAFPEDAFEPSVFDAVIVLLIPALITLVWLVVDIGGPAVDRLRLSESTFGHRRAVDTTPTETGGVTGALRASEIRGSVDDWTCTHCGADLAEDHDDAIVRRVRKDLMAGPVVAHRDFALNVYCDEDCEAGRLDPLLDSERTEEEEQEMTDPLGVLNRSD